MPKIINLILSSNRQPWLATEPIIRKTFKSHPDVQTIFYRGDSDKTYLDGDVLRLAVKDNWIYTKTGDAFRYLLQHFDFDFIFRSNNSSYVDYEKYVAYLNSVPGDLREFLYSGKILGHLSGVFCSGCGYTVSRKCVELVAGSDKKAQYESQDDVMVGIILAEHGIKPQAQPLIYFNEKVKQEGLAHFHYRCKELDRKNYVEFIDYAFTYLNASN